MEGTIHYSIMAPNFDLIYDYNFFQLRTARNAAKQRSKRNKARARKSISADELIHVSKSPNFCRYNPKKGILGTKGRECSKTSTGNDSCSILCCGRGYNTQVIFQFDSVEYMSTFYLNKGIEKIAEKRLTTIGGKLVEMMVQVVK